MEILGYICLALFLIGVSTGSLAKGILNLMELCRKDNKDNERNKVSQRIEEVEEANQ